MKKRLVGLVFFMAIFIAISLANLTSAADFSPKEIVLPELPPAPQTLSEKGNIPPLALVDIPDLECPNDLNYSFPIDDGRDGQMTDCRISGNLDLIPGDYNVKTIVVLANNSVFDCHGSNLYGIYPHADPVGIWVQGSNNTIKNCNLHDYNTGIVAGRPYHANESRNNTFFNNSMGAYDGIKITGWANNFSHNTIRAAHYGIKVEDNWVHPYVDEFLRDNYIGFNNISTEVYSYFYGDAFPLVGMQLRKMLNTTIVNNTIANTPLGIELITIENISIDGNKFRNVSDYGVDFGVNGGFLLNRAWGGFNLTNNYFEETFTGLLLFNDIGAFISGNKFISMNYGIQAHSLESPIIKDNYFEGNYIGLYAGHAYNFSVYSNTFKLSTAGIFFPDLYSYSDTNHKIYNNYFYANNEGLSFQDARYNYTHPFETTYNVYDNIFEGNSDCGVYADTTDANTILKIHENEAYENSAGICLLSGWKHFISNNDIHNNLYGLYITTDDPKQIFYNSLYSNAYYQVFSAYSREVSYGNYGNYWGRTSEPCFVAGEDSNNLVVVDSYPLCNFPSSEQHQLIILPNYGWYFVGFNLYPVSSEPSEVFKSLTGNYEVVQYYVNGEPKSYKPYPYPSYLNNLKSIEPWYGYWVKYTKWSDSGMLVFGQPVTGCDHGLTLLSSPVSDHWIGYWLQDEKETGEALASIEGNYEWVRTYNNENQQWESYFPDLPEFSDLKTMKPGHGYLIKMKNIDYLNYC